MPRSWRLHARRSGPDRRHTLRRARARLVQHPQRRTIGEKPERAREREEEERKGGGWKREGAEEEEEERASPRAVNESVLRSLLVVGSWSLVRNQWRSISARERPTIRGTHALSLATSRCRIPAAAVVAAVAVAATTAAAAAARRRRRRWRAALSDIEIARRTAHAAFARTPLSLVYSPMPPRLTSRGGSHGPARSARLAREHGHVLVKSHACQRAARWPAQIMVGCVRSGAVAVGGGGDRRCEARGPSLFSSSYTWVFSFSPVRSLTPSVFVLRSLAHWPPRRRRRHKTCRRESSRPGTTAREKTRHRVGTG